MDSVTQGNAANAQQTAAAAEELGSQSGELNGMVQQLEGLIKGSSASGTPSAADATVRPETHPRGNGPRRSRPAGRARTARPDQADDHASGRGDRAPSGRGAEPAEQGATEAASCDAEALSEF
jgi:methyl-accepting chemotaxis protein